MGLCLLKNYIIWLNNNYRPYDHIIIFRILFFLHKFFSVDNSL